MMPRIVAAAVLILAIAVGAFFWFFESGADEAGMAALGPALIEGASEGPSAGSAALPVEAGQVAPPAAVDPGTDPAVSETPEGDATGTAAVEPDQPAPAPAFDVVRVETDGSALVAGQAGPGQIVRILLDGETMAEVEAGADGNFVAFATLPPSDAPRVVTLVAGDVASEESVIVQPVAAPVELASAEPGAEDTAGVAPQVDTSDPGDSVESGEETLATVVSEATEAAIGTASNAETAEDDGTTVAEDDSTTVAEAVAASEDVTGDTARASATDAGDDADALEADASTTQASLSTLTGDTSAATATPDAAQTDQPTAAAAPRVLLADASGVRVVQDGGTGPRVEAVSIDAISYDAAGEVALSGRTTTDGSVRVYIDNEPLLTATGDAGQWRAELPQVDTGTYTLRVDELDTSGAVVSRAETPFRREAVEDIRALADTQPVQTAAVSLLTVQPGNTLWGIARGKYGDGLLYVRVFEANAGRIRNPDLIYPGQIFALPD